MYYLLHIQKPVDIDVESKCVPHILGKHGYKIFISDTVGDTEFSVSNDIEHQLESADIGCQSDISPKICEITQYLAVLSSKNFVKTSNIVTFYTFGQRYFYLCHRYWHRPSARIIPFSCDQAYTDTGAFLKIFYLFHFTKRLSSHFSGFVSAPPPIL